MPSSKKAKDDRQSSFWADLPLDIIEEIYKILTTDDYPNNTTTSEYRGILCSVCSNWHKSLKRIPLQREAESLAAHKFPFKTLPLPPPDAQRGQADTAALTQSHVFLCTPPPEEELADSKKTRWIVRVERRPDIKKWHIQNPLDVSTASFHFPDLFKVEVNMMKIIHCVKQVTRSYVLQYGTYRRKTKYSKVVIIWNEGFADFTALVLVEDKNYLGLWKPGEEGWNAVEGDLDDGGCNYFSDIISFNGKFYATTKQGKLMMIDPVTKQGNWVITDELASEGLSPSSRLVESNGHLYLVFKGVPPRPPPRQHTNYLTCSRPGDLIGFMPWPQPKRNEDIIRPERVRVFIMLEGNLNPHVCSWKTVDSIGDRVFFVGKYVSYSLTADDLGWLKGDCVVIPLVASELSTVRFSDREEAGCLADFLSVLSFEDTTTVASGSELDGKYSKIFWPPPEWFFRVFKDD